MWNLVKQWRLVRWVNSEIERHEKINLVVAAQTGITLLAPAVIQGYSDRRFVRASHVEIRRVLDDCVAKHRLDVVQQPNGLHVVVHRPEGREFVPFFSGLVLTVLRELGPVYSFMGGIVAGGGLIALGLKALHL